MCHTLIWEAARFRRRSGTVLAAIICVAVWGCGSTQVHQFHTAVSPDGRYTAIVNCKEKLGPRIPGPEPPKVKARWTILTISSGGRTVFTTGEEPASRGMLDCLDVQWCADSSKLAYQRAVDFRVIWTNGNFKRYDFLSPLERISSVKWCTDTDMLVVVKTARVPSDFGFTGRATRIRIVTVNLDIGVVERYSQPVKEPIFLHHSPWFCVNEISPYSSRVAFSDGRGICVYDDRENALVARKPIEGSIEGIWWADADTLILGLGVLSSSEEDWRFLKFSIPRQQTEDVTEELLPRWRPSDDVIAESNGDIFEGYGWSWRDPTWFRSAN